MKQDPLCIAQWRFEQISLFIDPRLTQGERSRMIEAASMIPVRWPSGDEKPVSRSSLYRWLERFIENPVIESLLPEPRKPRPAMCAIRPEWVEYSLALLEQEPARSLYILATSIKLHFKLESAPVKSSLHRALSREPRYLSLRRLDSGRSSRLRTRFQALNPHEIWHGDAKGPFPVWFADGSRATFRVLSILDDATRYILAAMVVLQEDIANVVAVFRNAAARWGLCRKWYADRGSPYDSYVFRGGISLLGVHRINTKARNKEAHGKIEAYHRPLKRWFVKELKHQLVVDPLHLQELLDAVLDQLYHPHHHKELNMSPRQALAGRISDRTVSLERLRDAFLIKKKLSPHKKTGELRVGKMLFKVPRQHLRPKVKVAVDPQHPETTFLVLDDTHLLPLEPAIKIAETKPSVGRNEPIGSLTPILESYRGRLLPQASPGFGLPEIYQAFARVLDRPVPATEQEARLVSEWLSRCGPLEPNAFSHALDKTLKRLGHGRPLSHILIHLEQMVDKKGDRP